MYTGKLPRKKYKSEANFHVPYVGSLLENVHPLLTANFPQTVVIARNERDRNSATLMNELLKYTFDANVFDFTFMMTQKSSMFYGDGWNKICWKYTDKETDHPSIIPLNSFDVMPHPKKIYLDDDFPIYLRAEMTPDEMIKEGWNKKKIQALGKSKLATPTYRRQQLQSMGQSNLSDKQTDQNPSDDLYEVVEVWGMQDLNFGKGEPDMQMACIVLVNDEVIVNDEAYFGKKPYASPYSHGKIPLVQLRYNAIPDFLLSESFIEPVASQQEELNALENMKADNYKRRNNPPLKVLKRGQVDLSALQFANSLPWLMETIDDVTPFEIPDLAPSIESQQNMIRTQMQARTGANDVLLVANDTSIKGGQSATGANIANENTKTRFKPQARLIDLYIQRIGDLAINMYQDKNFFDHEKAIAIADTDGNYSTMTVKPQQVQGDLMFDVESASSLAESNEQKLEKYINLKELYIQDPTVNQDEFDKKIFEAAGLDYNKMKKTVTSQMPDAIAKLKQLTAATQDPNFASQPPAQQQAILNQIQKLKMMVQQGMSGPQFPGLTQQPNDRQDIPQPVPAMPVGASQ